MNLPQKLIVNERIRDHEILKFFSDTAQLRYSSAIDVDFIFYDSKPTVAFCLFDLSSTPLSKLSETFDTMQRTFRHSYAVIVGAVSESSYYELQHKIPPGNAHLVKVSSMRQAYEFMMSCTVSIFDSTKLDVQKQYFVAEARNIASSQVAKGILLSALSRMDIDVSEACLIADMCGSIATVMDTNSSVLEQSCPISHRTASCLENFFSADI